MLDEETVLRFQLLQKWQKRPTAPVAYFLFDLLWFDGSDWTMQPLRLTHYGFGRLFRS